MASVMKSGRTDVEIWNLFRSGSKEAFEFIYQEYFDKLFNYGCQFTANRALVEDALQELFVELWKRKEHLSATDKILPYLYSAFRRKIIRLRDKTHRLSSLEEAKTFSIALNIETLLIEDETKREELLRLQKAMDKLSERHREIVYLFFFENLSYEEIKEIQGFDHVKSARNLLYKALQSLRLKLEGFYLLVYLLFMMGPRFFFKKISEILMSF